MSNDAADTPDAASWPASRVIATTLIVAAVVAGFWALYHFRLAVLLFFTALVLATSLRPIIDRLRSVFLPRIVATVVVHLSVFGLFLGFLLLMAPLIVAQTTEFIQTVPGQYEELRTQWAESGNRFVRRLTAELPANLSGLARQEAAAAAPLGGMLEVWGFFTSLVWIGFLIAAVFLLSIYWTVEEERILRTALLMVPFDHRDSARDLIAQIQDKLASFVLGQLILCFIVGAMSLAAYWLIGLPYALALAFIAGVLEAIPNIGPILATVPAVLVGLTVGPAAAGWVIFAQLMISLAENYLLVPRVMDESVGVHPVVTLLAITALVAAVGVLGGVLAIPLAAVVQVLLGRFVFEAPAVDVVEEDRDRVGVLKYQAQELIQDLHGHWRQVPPGPEDAQIDEAQQTVEAVVLDLTKALDWLGNEGKNP